MRQRRHADDSRRAGRCDACLKHLRVCEAFKAKGGEVATAPEKKRSEIDTLKAEMAAMRGDIATIWSMIKLQPLGSVRFESDDLVMGLMTNEASAVRRRLDLRTGCQINCRCSMSYQKENQFINSNGRHFKHHNKLPTV